jgi:hypothetical protein
MTDALTTDLAQIGSLKVISRTSAMQFKACKEALPQIGRDLQVDAVVEGGRAGRKCSRWGNSAAGLTVGLGSLSLRALAVVDPRRFRAFGGRSNQA